MGRVYQQGNKNQVKTEKVSGIINNNVLETRDSIKNPNVRNLPCLGILLAG
jgi:hypothetical protein